MGKFVTVQKRNAAHKSAGGGAPRIFPLVYRAPGFYCCRARPRNQFPLNRATERARRVPAVRPSNAVPKNRSGSWRCKRDGREREQSQPAENFQLDAAAAAAAATEQVKAISVCFVQRKYRVSASPASRVHRYR